MAYVADLHVHSKYAGACSGALNIPNLSQWAKYKGIDLLGTGDALHPIYQQELKKDLQDIGGGVYTHNGTKFLVTTEVALIYTENGKGRRVHILLFFPSLDAAIKLSETLGKKGFNYGYEGRPMLGMSCKALCELVFSIDPEIIIIPAHIWTPWYGMYGDKSGYDKLSDCFGEYSDQILAVETGISSEPAMNWRIGELDKKSIVSFSDLHSLPRLGREVTIFSGQPTFSDLRKALKNQNIIGTIEFFPEEGKYHYSGHRNCNVVWDSKQLREYGEICPKCNKQLTIGVIQRIEELSTRSIEDLRLTIKEGIHKSEFFPDRAGFRMLVQLEEIIAESMGMVVKSQKVQNEYLRLVTTLDTELKILTKVPIELISMAASEKLAEGVKRVREGKLSITPGFDNTYGIVKIWDEEETVTQDKDTQISLI